MTIARYIDHDIVADFAGDYVNLKPSEVKDHRVQVGRLRQRLEEHIAERPDYALVKMRHSGSVAKGTALKRVQDMDVAVYVKAGEAPAIESQLLSWLEERLKEALRPLGLKDDQFEPQDHCVRIRYVSSGLNVDVVPVLYEGEPDNIGYLITDTGARVKTSVTLHLDFIGTRKNAQPVDFAQVVRLVKWWVRQLKRQHGDEFRFKSFMVELICAHLADDGRDFSDYPAALMDVFTYIVRTGLEERIAFADYYQDSALPRDTGAAIEIFDPVNADNNVAASYTGAQRQAIVDAAHDALDAATEAAYADTKGRAVERWKTVLGPSFRG